MEGIVMEPLNSDLDYVVRERRSSNRSARFNWLLIFPALGVLWLLYLLGAALFQWSVTDVVSPVMVLMVFLFFALVALLFWAFAPGVGRGTHNE